MGLAISAPELWGLPDGSQTISVSSFPKSLGLQLELFISHSWVEPKEGVGKLISWEVVGDETLCFSTVMGTFCTALSPQDAPGELIPLISSPTELVFKEKEAAFPCTSLQRTKGKTNISLGYHRCPTQLGCARDKKHIPGVSVKGKVYRICLEISCACT